MGIYDRDYMLEDRNGKKKSDKTKSSYNSPRTYRSGNNEGWGSERTGFFLDVLASKLNVRPWLVHLLAWMVLGIFILKVWSSIGDKNTIVMPSKTKVSVDSIADSIDAYKSPYDDPARFQIEPLPVARMQDRAVLVSGGATVLKAGSDGHFFTSGSVNGFPVVLMVDTGATYVSINNDVAARAGITRCKKTRFSTVNGLIDGCIAVVESFEFGGFVLNNVEVGISKGMGQSLLGMNVLRLFRLQQSDGRLALYPGS